MGHCMSVLARPAEASSAPEPAAAASHTRRACQARTACCVFTALDLTDAGQCRCGGDKCPDRVARVPVRPTYEHSGSAGAPEDVLLGSLAAPPVRGRRLAVVVEAAHAEAAVIQNRDMAGHLGHGAGRGCQRAFLALSQVGRYVRKFDAVIEMHHVSLAPNHEEVALFPVSEG